MSSCSYYEGSTPIVVVSDAQTARQVMVNSFHACHARKTYPLQEDPDTEPDTNVYAHNLSALHYIWYFYS